MFDYRKTKKKTKKYISNSREIEREMHTKASNIMREKNGIYKINNLKKKKKSFEILRKISFSFASLSQISFIIEVNIINKVPYFRYFLCYIFFIQTLLLLNFYNN